MSWAFFVSVRNGLKGFQEAHGANAFMLGLQLGRGLLGKIVRRIIGDILVFGYGHSVEMIFRKPDLRSENSLDFSGHTASNSQLANE